MIAIQPLTSITPSQLRRLITGYHSDASYALHKSETDGETIFQLRLEMLPRPLFHRYDHLDDGTIRHYQELLNGGLSLGAWDQDDLVGIALGERRDWNRSLWVWEFHVAETHQRRGIGRSLMEQLAEQAEATGLRTIVCETQSCNVPAIRFYRKVGFVLDGLDFSYYSNEDQQKEEIAVFMKRPLSS